MQRLVQDGVKEVGEVCVGDYIYPVETSRASRRVTHIYETPATRVIYYDHNAGFIRRIVVPLKSHIWVSHR